MNTQTNSFRVYFNYHDNDITSIDNFDTKEDCLSFIKECYEADQNNRIKHYTIVEPVLRGLNAYYNVQYAIASQRALDKLWGGEK